MTRGAGLQTRSRPGARNGAAPARSTPARPARPRPVPASIVVYPPFRRTTKRRPEPLPDHRPLKLVVALHVVVASLLLLGACTAMPAGVALLALEAQSWMSEHTIDLPRE